MGLRISTWLRVIAAASGLILLQGCYLVKQGAYLLTYTTRAVNNETLLNAQDTPAETRAFLQRVQDISKFAETHLGLEKNKNYSRFTEIDQDFLAWVVSGAGSYSFESYQWKFPLVGKMPYKGFYRKDDALEEASRLKEKGYDVWIRKVDAFSTLGYLIDPLYSYMMDYSIYAIANLLIHEQVHATVFLKGQGDFNENFATFVGDAGARLYIEDTYGKDSEEYRNIGRREADREVFHEDLQELRGELQYLYDLKPEDMDNKKQECIARFQEKFRESYETRYLTDAYRGFPDLPVNNAFISLYSLYNSNQDIFHELYRACGEDLPRCIEDVKNAVKGSEDPYETVRTLIQAYD